MPLVFERNVGQAPADALYVARSQGYEIRLEPGGISLVQGASTVHMRLDGAQPGAQVHGCELQDGKANYLIGDQRRWRAGIPLYGKAEYRGVYPGTDLFLYGNNGQLEYDFSLAPGARADRIRLSFDGVERLRIEEGDLVLETFRGELRHRKPRLYQRRGGRRVEVSGRFVLHGPQQAGFVVDNYDANETLVIDPVLQFGTYLGGTGNDQAWAVAVDAAGCTYLAGETWPVGFLRTYNFSLSSGNQDAFLVKLNPAGTAVVYATYFGGRGRDSARGLAVDVAGNAYITGFTNSMDFPTTAGAYRTTPAGQEDAFVVKLNASGSVLLYSTLLGGAGADFATGIALDNGGSAYISGYTSSLAFPVTTGAFQKAFGGGLQDGFAVKLNANGSGLIYATYVGGHGNDVANGLAVDSLGFAYIVGYTDSSDFPVKNSLQTFTGGQGDGFIAKLNPAGDGLAYATFLGGRLVDNITAVAVDASGSAYVTGSTLSADFPTTVGALQTAKLGGYDAFVSKLNPQGNALMYSSFFGAEGTEQGNAIAVDRNGVVYVVGFTDSQHFPLLAPVESAPRGSRDGFAAAVSATGATLLWSTYLGGAAEDQGTAVAVDVSGAVYVAGFTSSFDFPTTSGAYRSTYIGGGDAFVAKLTLNTPPVAVSGTPGSAVATPQTFTFTGRDLDGYADIANMYFLINTGPVVAANTCHGMYVRASNTLWLLNDTATGLLGPIIVGSSGTLQNRQCTVYGNTSSVVSANGTDLVINIALGLQGTYAASAEKVFLWVKDLGGHDTGWVQTGTWSKSTFSNSPVAVSGTPSSAIATPQTFTFTGRDLDGYSDIANMYFLINTGPVVAANTCHGMYVRASNTLWLLNDTATGLLGPIIAGSSGTLQNSQCVVYANTSSVVSVSGTDLVINIALGLQGTYAASAEKVFLWVKDNEGHDTGWVQTGTWSKGTFSNLPVAVSGTPGSAIATPQTFTFTGRDLDGYADIANMYFLINTSPVVTANSCHGMYIRTSNTLWLLNDTATGLLGPIIVGSTGTLQNSQCVVYANTSSVVSANGTDMVINIALGRKGTYVTAAEKVFLWVKDNEGHDTGWIQTGTWSR